MKKQITKKVEKYFLKPQIDNKISQKKIDYHNNDNKNNIFFSNHMLKK